MVFVRKTKDYYVLTHSIRKNNKITQKTKYLGKELPPKSRIEQLKKEFLKEIQGEKFKYLNKEDLEMVEKKKEEYNKEIKKLSKLEKKKHFEDFMIRYTYDSSKLSGVDVTLRQTSLILKDGIIPKNFKSIKTVKEIENHEKGVVAITKYNGVLNLNFIKKLHTILFSGVDDEVAGKLRSELKRNVKITGTVYVPPKWNDIDKEIDLFFNWYHSENRKFHPIELAALVHLKMISLQPFVDGNSRLSRLLMNWVLWKKKYPLIDIKIEDLENYYDALDEYQIEHKERPFVNYIKEKFLEI
ncbi:Fic family protein [archaeon]|mgnify:FL=1|jgi:Fic family protein|nr:Fic family protein [archaeon]MBT4416509.1 Fic family protein [archaeon]